jgi:hypothetical protein
MILRCRICTPWIPPDWSWGPTRLRRVASQHLSMKRALLAVTAASLRAKDPIDGIFVSRYDTLFYQEVSRGEAVRM